MIVPYPCDPLSFSGTYYAPSFEDNQEFLKLLVIEELKADNWKQLFLTEDKKRDCLNSVYVRKGSQRKTGQLLWDEFSARKRKRWGLLFT